MLPRNFIYSSSRSDISVHVYVTEGSRDFNSKYMGALSYTLFVTKALAVSWFNLYLQPRKRQWEIVGGSTMCGILREYKFGIVYCIDSVCTSKNDYGRTVIEEPFLQLKDANLLKCCSLWNQLWKKNTKNHKNNWKETYAGSTHFPMKWISKRMSSHETLQWRHNDRDGVSNHRRFDCLLNSLLRRRPKKTTKFHATGLNVWLAQVDKKRQKVPRMKSFTLENIRVSKVSCIKRYAYQKFRV